MGLWNKKFEFDAVLNDIFYAGTFEVSETNVSKAIGFGPNKFEVTFDIEFTMIASIDDEGNEIFIDLRLSRGPFLKALKDVVINNYKEMMKVQDAILREID